MEKGLEITVCCSHPAGFCAGSREQALKTVVKEYLEKEDKEYDGDNVILALFNMAYIK